MLSLVAYYVFFFNASPLAHLAGAKNVTRCAIAELILARPACGLFGDFHECARGEHQKDDAVIAILVHYGSSSIVHARDPLQ